MRAAACVNIVPSVQSVYHWQGKVHSDEESLMIIKTRTDLQDQLTTFVTATHSYDVPEVVFLPIQAGSIPYLQWISDNTLGGKDATATPAAAGVLATAPGNADIPEL